MKEVLRIGNSPILTLKPRIEISALQITVGAEAKPVGLINSSSGSISSKSKKSSSRSGEKSVRTHVFL